MMTVTENVKQETREPYRAVFREFDKAYSTMMRWRSRRKAGEAVIGNPGPAKVEPLRAGELHEEIRLLALGSQRVRGSVALQQRYCDQISRRDFQARMEDARREYRQEENALERRIEWLVTGLVWSMDDTKKHWLQEDRFGHAHLVMDLGSHYKLRVLGDDVQADGWKVAMNMEALFLKYEPPLFFKIDGGSNFRHEAVMAMFDKYWVIPLISPPYYPPYNGGIERGHQEILRELQDRIGGETVSAQVLRLQCEISGHEVNHKQRRSLGGHTACHALESGRPAVRQFGRRERKEIYEEIKALTVDIVRELGDHWGRAVETAFRYAAETWMQANNIIRITKNGEVLPCFYQIRSH